MATKMTRAERERFFTTLAHATDEHAVRTAYESGFLIFLPKGTAFDYPCKCDGYLDVDMFLRLLLEYKLNERLEEAPQRAKVLVQLIFYLKQFEEAGIELPSVLFVGDRDECFLLHSNDVLGYLDYDADWTIPPSDAWRRQPSLLAAVTTDCAQKVFVYHVNERQFDLREVLDRAHELAQDIVRHVRATPANVTRIFDYFCEKVLREPDLSPNDCVGCFFAAILRDTDTYLHPNYPNILFYREKQKIRIDRAGWDAYFAHYDNTYTPRERAAFTAIYDRLLEDVKRRRNGEFYTPTVFVNHAHLLIAQSLDPDWRDRYVVWDCAWGTGNLTRDFRFARLYASTNEPAELHLGQAYNPESTKFLFDFLNDPIDDLFSKLPPALVADLEADKPFLFFINPPYATANNLKHGTHKAGCALTAVNAEMKDDNMGAAAQQLFAQFLYRIIQIKERFHLTNCNLALFCNPIWLSGSQHRRLRERFFKTFSYHCGILFNAGSFADVAANWGIHFTVWQAGPTADIHNFPHTLIENSEGRLIPVGNKTLYNLDGEQTGSDWCKEPLGKAKGLDAPQLSSALKWKEKGVGTLVPGALGYYVNASNAVYNNATCVCLLSGTSSKGHGTSVLPSNFLRVTANFTARKLISQDWTNAKDEYCVPNVDHPDYPGFEADSVIFALFHASSQQSSLGHVDYKGREWDIPNQWFWLTRDEAEEAINAAGLTEMWQALHTDTERYVATHLPDWEPRMSPEAREVLRLARRIAKASYAHRAEMDTLRPDLQLRRWDAGWHQLKPLVQAYLPADFAAFQTAFRALSTRLRPLVHTLGFLR